VDTIVPAPEAALWEGFDGICADAEAKRDLAVQAARGARLGQAVYPGLEGVSARSSCRAGSLRGDGEGGDRALRTNLSDGRKSSNKALDEPPEA